MELTIDLDEHFVEMPPPIRERVGSVDPLLSDLRRDIGPKRFHQWRVASGNWAQVAYIALIEPLHEHEPIDRGSGSADREPFTGIHQRQDVEIDIRRERAIEPQLGAAGGRAPG